MNFLPRMCCQNGEDVPFISLCFVYLDVFSKAAMYCALSAIVYDAIASKS